MSDTRQCFYIDESQDPADHGGYVPSLVVENEPGHSPMTGNGVGAAPWVWGDTLQQAQSIAEERNLEMFKVTRQEAIDIVMSSMAASLRRR